MTDFFYHSIPFYSIPFLIRIGYSGSLLKFLNNQMVFGTYSFNFIFHAGCHHNNMASVQDPPINFVMKDVAPALGN